MLTTVHVYFFFLTETGVHMWWPRQWAVW